MAHIPKMAECIQECLDCHSICLETVTHCLEKGGRHTGANHIGPLLDCAEICQISANYMLRGSTLHGRTCGLCADVCERCAQDCEQFSEDAQMKDCCLRCAESCRQMASVARAA